MRCSLAAGRTQVVFGEGNARRRRSCSSARHRASTRIARACRSPGARASCSSGCSAAVGIALDDVYLATVLKCRPPGNRDPLPEETSACEPYLYRQLELVQPTVVATLGSFATALLSGRALGITRVHGAGAAGDARRRAAVMLYPLYHPAAALYTPTMLAVLERDVARLPELPRRDAASGGRSRVAPRAEHEALAGARPVQLGLF